MSKLQDLEDAIRNPQYKVISFDMFDTLVLRPSIFPTDLFTIVGRVCGWADSFSLIRKNSERFARQQQSIGVDEISFFNIYDMMKNYYNYSSDEIKAFAHNELDCEYSLIYARKSAKRLFDLAVGLGKKVIIVSDIYLSHSFVLNVLSHCGYTNFYKVYLSSDYKMTKNTGRLYQLVKAEMSKQGINASEILHIGDNESSDVAIAKREGIDALQIRRVENVANTDVTFRRLRSLSDRRCDNTFLMGFAANRIYDIYDKKCLGNNLRFITDAKSVTNILIAPLVFSYAKWLIDEYCRCNKKRIVFIGNEGMLLENVIRIISEYIAPDLTILRYENDVNFQRWGYGSIEDVFKSSIDPHMMVGDFIAQFVDLPLGQRELSAIQKHGYKTFDEKVGYVNAYLPLVNEIIALKEADLEHRIKEIQENTPALFDEQSLVFSTKHADILNRIMHTSGCNNVVYTIFSESTSQINNLNFMVQFGRMSQRDLMSVRQRLEVIIDSSCNNPYRIVGNSVDISGEVLDYAIKFCHLFGKYIQYLHLDSYQFYEFIRLAFYEYKDFILH